MKYNIVIKKKVAKGLRKFPVWAQKKMAILANDLRKKRRVRKNQHVKTTADAVRQNTIATWERVGWLTGSIKTRQ